MKNVVPDNKEKECICKKCGLHFTYNEEDTWWDEFGYGYSTKLTKCKNKECNCISVIRYDEDSSLNLNYDLKFYEYAKIGFNKKYKK